MSTTEIDPQDLHAAVRDISPGQPVTMVNLLRFRSEAHYADTAWAAAHQLPAVSGQEAYLTRYLPAFTEVMAPHGASEVIFAATVTARMVGPVDARWDVVAAATYPSIQVFRDLVVDPAYLAQAAPHRLAALADWQLFATTPLAG